MLEKGSGSACLHLYGPRGSESWDERYVVLRLFLQHMPVAGSLVPAACDVGRASSAAGAYSGVGVVWIMGSPDGEYKEITFGPFGDPVGA